MGKEREGSRESVISKRISLWQMKRIWKVSTVVSDIKVTSQDKNIVKNRTIIEKRKITNVFIVKNIACPNYFCRLLI